MLAQIGAAFGLVIRVGSGSIDVIGGPRLVLEERAQKFLLLGRVIGVRKGILDVVHRVRRHEAATLEVLHPSKYGVAVCGRQSVRHLGSGGLNTSSILVGTVKKTAADNNGHGVQTGDVINKQIKI